MFDSAIEHGVKNVVVLSTDKACYPINAMGISKAMMEKVAIAKGRQMGEGGQNYHLLYPLWQCDGKPRISDPFVGGANEGRQGYHNNRSEHDPFYDDTG